MVDRAGLRGINPGSTAVPGRPVVADDSDAWYAVARAAGEINERLIVPRAAAAAKQRGARDAREGVIRPRIPDSVIDQAYNNAAEAGYLSRMQVGWAQRLDALEKEHGFDVGAFQRAAEAARTAMLSDAPEAFALSVDTRLGREIEERAGRIARTQQTRQLNDDKSAVVAHIENLENKLSAFAFMDGGLQREDAQTALADYEAALAAAQNPLFGIAPADLKQRREQVFSRIRARNASLVVEETYRAGGLEAAEALAQEFLTDETLNLSLAEREQFYGDAIRGVRAMEAERYRTEREAAAALRDAQRDLETLFRDEIDVTKDLMAVGAAVPPARLLELGGLAQATGNPMLMRRYQELAATVAAKPGIDALSPQELQVFVERERVAVSEDPTANNVDAAILGYAVKRLASLPTALDHDMMGVAVADGLIRPEQVGALDFTDLTPGAIADRLYASAAVANRYGRPPTFFRPAEREQLQAIAERGGPEMVRVITAIAQGAREDAPRVLREVSKASPLLAHLGSIVAEGGSQNFAADVAARLQAQGAGQGATERRLPQGWKADSAEERAMQEATSGISGLSDVVRNAVELAYEQRAARTNSRDVRERQVDANIMKPVVQEALGATTYAGRQYGGVVRYPPGNALAQGRYTLIPSWIAADDFEAVINTLAADEAARTAAGGLLHGASPDGRLTPYPANALKRAKLVAIGPGRYRVALGNPDSATPNYALDANGEVYVLDLAAARNVLNRLAPSSVRAGGPQR